MKKILLLFFATVPSISSLHSMNLNDEQENSYQNKKIFAGITKMVEGCYGYPVDVFRKYSASGDRDFMFGPLHRQITFLYNVGKKLYSREQDIKLFLDGIRTTTKSLLVPHFLKKEWYNQTIKYSKIAVGLGASYYFYTNPYEHKKAYCGAALLFAADSYFNNSIQKSFYFPFILIGFKSL